MKDAGSERMMISCSLEPIELRPHEFKENRELISNWFSSSYIFCSISFVAGFQEDTR